jgi:CBS domain-containing protein
MTRATAARALRTLTARDVMRMQMITVVPEMTVRELAQTLVEAGVRSVPVLGPTGKVLGVASQTDVARLALRGAPAVDPAPADVGAGEDDAGVRAMMNGVPDRLRVRDVMGPVGPTVLPDEPLPELLRIFVRDREHRALVVENDMLLGIVTPVDVLGAIEEG